VGSTITQEENCERGKSVIGTHVAMSSLWESPWAVYSRLKGLKFLNTHQRTKEKDQSQQRYLSLQGVIDRLLINTYSIVLTEFVHVSNGKYVGCAPC